MTGWTFETLRERLLAEIAAVDRVSSESDAALHVELSRRVEQLHAEITSALKANTVAQNRAAEAIEHRFATVNEFRAQLADQTSTFMPRAELDARLATITDSINVLNGHDAERTGRTTGGFATWSAIVGGSTLLTLILSVTVTILLTKH